MPCTYYCFPISVFSFYIGNTWIPSCLWNELLASNISTLHQLEIRGNAGFSQAQWQMFVEHGVFGFSCKQCVKPTTSENPGRRKFTNHLYQEKDD